MKKATKKEMVQLKEVQMEAATDCGVNKMNNKSIIINFKLASIGFWFDLGVVLVLVK